MPPSTYTVRAGDTLSQIAKRYGLNYMDIARQNNIANPNRIRIGQSLNLGGAAAPAAAPAAITANNNPLGIPTPQARTAFSEVLPYEKVFNRNLITGLAESQINPEVRRQMQAGMTQLAGQLASTGAYRTGRGAQAQTNLADAFERQRKEQVQDFINQMGNYTTDWYSRQQEQYYKNPSGFVMPTLPSYDEYLRNNPTLADAFNKQTNIQTTYTNPFNF